MTAAVIIIDSGGEHAVGISSNMDGMLQLAACCHYSSIEESRYNITNLLTNDYNVV